MYEAVKVANFATKTEAQSAGRTLESEGIPYLIKSDRMPAVKEPPPGATIFVAPDIAARAKEVLGIENEPVN
ncbi:MAG: hypothetical protein GWN83_01600 [Gemmatimonadetes bacterium]|nr:hypothetical protein [Gemmatimonadota bacterium]NIY42351.1 hypothetical protein [Gemmatimonadota bacterium]